MKVSIVLGILSCLLLCCSCANPQAKGGTGDAALTGNFSNQDLGYQPPSQPDYPQVLASPGPF